MRRFNKLVRLYTHEFTFQKFNMFEYLNNILHNTRKTFDTIFLHIDVTE
jgi:hypothetical protein